MVKLRSRPMRQNELNQLRLLIFYSEPHKELQYWEEHGQPENCAWTLIKAMIDYHNDCVPEDQHIVIELKPARRALPVSRYDQEVLLSEMPNPKE